MNLHSCIPVPGENAVLYTASLPAESLQMLTQRERTVLDLMHAFIKTAAWQKVANTTAELLKFRPV